MAIELSIISPLKTIFQDKVDSFIAPGEDGLLGVLKNHAPIISLLKKGEIVVTQGSQQEKFPIESGFLNLVNNQAIIIID